jgi:hemoglobin
VSLDISDNYLGPEAATLIAQAVRQRSTECDQLVELDCRWNQFGLEGCRSLVEAFRYPVKLMVSSNGVARTELDAVLRAVPHMQDVPLTSLASDPDFAARVDAEVEALLDGQTIYALVGGAPALEAVVETFYVRLLTDRQLSRFFTNVTMGRMRHLMTSFLCSVLGGPEKYKGLSMGPAHAHMSLSDDEFDATIAHLVQAVLHHLPHAPVPLLQKLLLLTESLRSSVVTKHLPGGKVAADGDGKAAAAASYDEVQAYTDDVQV